jgi:hypothetical protein
MATRVITLRSERGYSATNYDGSAVKHPKNLRRQFGKFYDGKKVRNMYWRRATKESVHRLLLPHRRRIKTSDDHGQSRDSIALTVRETGDQKL